MPKTPRPRASMIPFFWKSSLRPDVKNPLKRSPEDDAWARLPFVLPALTCGIVIGLSPLRGSVQCITFVIACTQASFQAQQPEQVRGRAVGRKTEPFDQQRIILHQARI